MIEYTVCVFDDIHVASSYWLTAYQHCKRVINSLKASSKRTQLQRQEISMSTIEARLFILSLLL
jgi:hypothetical protein